MIFITIISAVIESAELPWANESSDLLYTLNMLNVNIYLENSYSVLLLCCCFLKIIKCIVNLLHVSTETNFRYHSLVGLIDALFKQILL